MFYFDDGAPSADDLHVTELIRPEYLQVGDFFWGVSDDLDDTRVETTGRRIDSISAVCEQGLVHYNLEFEGRTSSVRGDKFARIQRRGLGWEMATSMLRGYHCPVPPLPERQRAQMRIESQSSWSSMPYFDFIERATSQDARWNLALGGDPQDLCALRIVATPDALELQVLVVVKPVAVFLRIATELDYQDRVPSSSVRRFRNVFGAMKSFLDDGEAMGAHPTTWYVFDCDAVDAEFQLIELNRWGSIEEALEKRKRYGLVDDLAEAWDGIRATPVTCGKDSVW